jgi:hypothetical protein
MMPRKNRKSQARNPNSETNTNDRNPKFKTDDPLAPLSKEGTGEFETCPELNEFENLVI